MLLGLGNVQISDDAFFGAPDPPHSDAFLLVFFKYSFKKDLTYPWPSPSRASSDIWTLPYYNGTLIILIYDWWKIPFRLLYHDSTVVYFLKFNLVTFFSGIPSNVSLVSALIITLKRWAYFFCCYAHVYVFFPCWTMIYAAPLPPDIMWASPPTRPPWSGIYRRCWRWVHVSA